MAGRTTAGEMRTRIMIFDHPMSSSGLDDAGFPLADKVNVLGKGRVVHCKWVNAYGSEVYEARQVGVTEPATLTMRYTPLVTTTSEIYRIGDDRPYEVISVNDVLDRHTWLEVKIQRKAAAT